MFIVLNMADSSQVKQGMMINSYKNMFSQFSKQINYKFL